MCLAIEKGSSSTGCVPYTEHMTDQPNIDPRFEDDVKAAQTVVTKLVFPGDTNYLQTLFGGTALQWMDEVASMTASRFTHQTMVTVSMDRVDFKTPIPSGCIVELVGSIARVGNTSLGIHVDLFKESRSTGERMLAISGDLTFVAVDAAMEPVQLSVHAQP